MPPKKCAILPRMVQRDKLITLFKPAILRFDGHCDHWTIWMENFLRSKDLFDMVETSYEELSKGNALLAVQQQRLTTLKLKDLKVKNYLFQSIDQTILETMLQKKMSKEIWDSMKKKYQGSMRLKRAQLQAEFVAVAVCLFQAIWL